MKKKAFLISIILLLCFDLYATTYKSNSIGQKLGPYNSDSDFYLVEEVSNNTTIEKLYNQNKLIQTKTTEINLPIKMITLDNGISITRDTYNNNQLISEIKNDVKIIYTYEDNLLISKTISEESKTIEINKYIYSSNNKLSSILKIRNDKELFYTFNYSNKNINIYYGELNTQNYKKSQINNSIINSTQYINDELVNNIEVQENIDNSITLKKENINNSEVETYKDGLLIKKDKYNTSKVLINSIEYSYDENFTINKKVETDIKFNQLTKAYDKITKTITTYVNSVIENVEIYENNVLISNHYFDDNNLKIENLYKNNEVYCTITYKNDKIIDIQYREVNDGL